MKPSSYLLRRVRGLSAIGTRLSKAGLFVATLFFAFSLAPSLLPRPVVFQGVVSGLSLALGYALGVAGRWLWSYLEIPLPRARTERALTVAAAVVGIVFVSAFLWRAAEWQNSVRRLMGMPEAGGQPVIVAIIALVLFAALLHIARRFRATFTFLSERLDRFLPRRVSKVLGIAASVVLFWGIIDGVFVTLGLRVADRLSEQVDAAIPPELERPEDPARTGSPASLVPWEDLGHQGRTFVSSGPTAGDLAAFLGESARAPVRVYVGLHAAPTPEARAQLALQELERVGGFARSVLLVVTPTGTGWIDPFALDTVEYLQRGDIASVAVQYSYLPSFLALPAEGAYGAENARALFQAVYGRWTTLPRESRPALYLFGLSLGALNAGRSFDAHDIIGDPFNGVLLAGTPFRSELWNSVTEGRRPGSPAWLPRFRDGSVVRFMNQDGGLETGDAPWGPFRIAFLQYASDAMTFFSVQSLYREPEWMREPRGPDVSPALRWYPVVTMVQLAADMAVANNPSPGYGHNFAAEHYIDAWLALMEPKGWPPQDIGRLKALHRVRRGIEE